MTDKPLHQAFGDAARAPSSVLKSTFNQAADPILEKAARVTEKAERHLEKHRNSWVAARYGELLKKDSPAPALKPHGSREDRTAHLVRTANHLVKRRHQSRLETIKAASERMRKGRDQGLEK